MIVRQLYIIILPPKKILSRAGNVFCRLAQIGSIYIIYSAQTSGEKGRIKDKKDVIECHPECVLECSCNRKRAKVFPGVWSIWLQKFRRQSSVYAVGWMGAKFFTEGCFI